MNRIVIICATILMTASIFAQTPEQMSYQAVIRDSADELVTNTQVGMQISILQGTANGNAVYVETQTPTSNANGLVSLEIGAGTIVSGDFSTIDWANGPYFIKTETDPTGGTNYSITGTSQLISVPYALYAKSAESVDETDPAYTQSEAANITASDITNLGNLSGTNTGDQDLSAYLTAETDPAYTQSEAANITFDDITNLGNLSGTNTGDQDLSGYLTVETDPAYTQSEAANITASDITNLGNLSGTNTGDQDLSGYLTTETDPAYTQSEAANITASDITNLGNLSGTNTGDQDLSGYLTAEADPEYTQSEAANITASDITNLGNLSGTNTGDQDLSGYLTAETDPAYTQSEAANITFDDITNLGNLSGTNTGDQDLSGYLTAETDPAYTQSEAANITSDDITNLGNLSGTNTGDQDLSGYLTAETDPTVTANFDLTTPENGDVLQYDASAGKWIKRTISGDITIDNTGVSAVGTDKVLTQMIADGTILAEDLASDAVETAKIKDSNITTEKIADASITSIKLADGVVTSAKIADNAVGTNSLKDASVTIDKLANFDLTNANDGDLLQYNGSTEKWVKVTPGYISNGDNNVGIGTTSPDPSAALELESTDKGLLPPRMTFLQKNNITTPAQGLLIFQTDEDSGFYYFNGSTWEKVGSVDAQTLSISGQELSISDGNTINLPDNWSLAGNMNTTSSNFLGTTDSNPLRFRVNDQETMLLRANRTLNVITNAGYNASTTPLLSKANSTLLLTSNTGDRSEAVIAFDVEPAFGARMQEGFLTFKKYQNNGGGASSSVGSRFIFSLKQNGGPVNNVLTISNNKSVGIDGRLNITDNLIVNSQVGIGTTDPKATLQIEGNPTNTTSADGIQGPTLSLAQLDAKVAAYGNDQDGAIVYIDNVTAASTETETANITTTGYYFYDAPNDVWNAMKTTTYSVGDFAQGGIVFWVDETGQHGLVAAKEDQSAGKWYAGTFGNTQAKGDGPYAGEANTSIIIAAQVAIGDDGSTYAARICNELQVAEGGKTYGDWYLPSKEELDLMYQNKATIDATAGANGGSGFASSYYWSSTEDRKSYAWRQYFGNGGQASDGKNNSRWVRAVRAF